MKSGYKSYISFMALLAAGPASAAITLGSEQGGSSLFLSVWDSVRSVSYTRNLGTNLNGFLPSNLTTLPNDGNVVGTAVTGNRTPGAGVVATFPGDALFTSTFGASSPADVKWNIVAFDSVASIGGGLSRVITTAAAPPNTTNAGIGLIATGGTTYLAALLNDYPVFSDPGQNSVVATNPELNSFAGRANWGEGLNGGNLTSSATGFASELGFYYLARTQVSGINTTLATNMRFQNSANFAKWTLAANGTATYSLDAAGAAPIPLPPAVGLFGAGLAALWGIARRRASSTRGGGASANEPCARNQCTAA